MKLLLIIAAAALLTGCAGVGSKGGYYVRYGPFDTVFYQVPGR